jgi:DNA polymerase III subunit gamma/tau
MSEAILSLSLRPQSFDVMVGSVSLTSAIRKQVGSRAPQAWMFSGPSGSGKTTIARIMAIAYQCTHQKEWGNPCQDCVANSRNFNIFEINASEVNGVEEITQVAQSSRLLPMQPSQRRVYILDEAQRLTSQAQNVLLKYFEDAPKTTVWIICTTEPSKILATLKRRCLLHNVKPLSMEDTEKLVKKACKVTGTDKDPKVLLEALYEADVNTPATVLMAVEKWVSGTTAKEAINTEASSVNTLRVCKAVSNGDWLTLRKELKGMAAEESRLVRSSVAGWLKGWLLREVDPKKRMVLASSILELLSSNSPLDDPALSVWLTARLYEICRKLKIQ